MRVITWNMNQPFRRDQHASAWDWLIRTYHPDVVFAQEAVPPDGLQHAGDFIDPDANSPYHWGTWIVATNPAVTLTPIPQVALGTYAAPPALPISHPGACAVTTMQEPGRNPFVGVSLYGLLDNTGDGRTRHATTSLHRMVSDLMPLFEQAAPVLLAGDLNITTQPYRHDSAGWWQKLDHTVFCRLDVLGLTNLTITDRFHRGTADPDCPCGDQDNCSHVRTVRHQNKSDSTPYQDDWAFLSSTASHCFTSGHAIGGETWDYSDHCPLLIDLHLPADTGS